MGSEYKAHYGIMYSSDKVLPGWNIRFYKSGKTLCRLYPKKNAFTALLVVGRKEKQKVEAVLPEMSPDMQKIYVNTREGMGQRWLIIDLKDHNELFDDVLTVVSIRRGR